MTRLIEQRVVRVPLSAAMEYAEEYFTGGHRGFDLHVPFRKQVRLVFNRRLDDGEPGRPHDLLVLGWTAGTRLLPDFRGGLSMRIASVHETRLTLEGLYDPPFGAAGAFFDALAGRRIARATMRDMLRRLGAMMEAREEEYRERERAQM